MSDDQRPSSRSILAQRRKVLKRLLAAGYVIPLIESISSEALAQGRPKVSRVPIRMMMGSM